MDKPVWAEANSFKGTVYHGSHLQEPEDTIWTDLSYDYGDWEAVWVTPDEKAAEAFSTRYIGMPGENAEIPFVIRMEVDIRNLIDLRGLEDDPDVEEFVYDWCGTDIRECISIFHRWGFDGWITNGSIESLIREAIIYDDIAVWKGRLGGTEVKLLLPDGTWTDYMSEDEANEYLGIQ